MTGGWGGLTGEYLFLPRSLVMPWLGLMLGGGGLGRTTAPGVVETAGLLVAEPTVGAQVGVTEFLRLAVGGSYRLAVCLGCPPGLDTGRTSGPSGVVELRFGHF